ncbi:MAG: hypothetical protein WCC36_01655 [Gammaproteobacteria bacterium]
MRRSPGSFHDWPTARCLHGVAVGISALGFYSTTVTNNFKVQITFDGTASASYLGKSSSGFTQASYGSHFNALTASASSGHDATALTNLPASDPFSTGTVFVNQSNPIQSNPMQWRSA